MGGIDARPASRCGRPGRRTRLAGWGVLAAALASIACAGPERTAARPNVLLLDVDTLRADHLGCYGYRRATSPRIDALAARSHRFEWAFAQAPYTPPSQSSLLTGLYVSHHGVRTRQDRLADEIETVAERFRANGYSTAGFVDGGFLSRDFGLAQGFAEYDDRGGGLAEIGPKFLRWLTNSPPEPFLAFLHTYDVHTPYAPHAEHRALFLEGLEPASPGFEASSEQMEDARTSMWTDRPRPLPERDLRFAEALYDAEIRFVDDWIGTILDRLDALGLSDRTIVVLVSDHGEEFGEHGSVLHEKPYATVTRIPLVIRLPRAEAGATHLAPVQGVDLGPTLIDLAGLDPLPHRDGRTLAPALRGERLPRPFAFGENPWIHPGQYLVEGDWQLLYHPGTPRLELYRLSSDPLQRQDLSAREPERVAELSKQLAARVAALAASARSAGRAEIDPDTERQLRALGYL